LKLASSILPELVSDLERIDALGLPSGALVAGTVHLAWAFGQGSGNFEKQPHAK
jgi:hypothetical protein